MAKITTTKRKALPKSEFGLPSKAKKGPRGGAPRGAFPIDTKARAMNAKARAMQQLKAGNLTRSQFDEIITRSNDKLRAVKAKDIKTASEMLNKR
jgi:hypothetical protein